MVPRPRLGRA